MRDIRPLINKGRVVKGSQDLGYCINYVSGTSALSSALSTYLIYPMLLRGVDQIFESKHLGR